MTDTVLKLARIKKLTLGIINMTNIDKRQEASYNSYDKYGQKTGSYKTNSNGVTTKYNKYGQKVGSFKKDSSGRITEYDKYGRKVGSYK